MKLKSMVTQSMVDRLILESICEFLLTIYSPNGEALQKAAVRTIQSRHYSEIAEHERKHRSNCQSPGSSQLNQFLSNQKHSEDGKRQSSKLQGLSFNLQTGSISGLTSVPGSEGHRPDSGSKFKGQGSSSRSRSPAMSHDSRSITIDLTKDPNSQLTSALSKRKSQLQPPTESQTEAAVAAILGSDPETKIDPLPAQTPIIPDSHDHKKRTTVLPSPSSNFERFSSSGARDPTTTRSDNASFSMTLGGSIGNISTQTLKPKDQATTFKPISTPRSPTFVERYQSIVAS
uniref:Uncharacterized protein n=1 Tax=Ciona savignyi TaxID=51511 RepID=H2YES6_CIOSA